MHDALNCITWMQGKDHSNYVLINHISAFATEISISTSPVITGETDIDQDGGGALRSADAHSAIKRPNCITWIQGKDHRQLSAHKPRFRI